MIDAHRLECLKGAHSLVVAALDRAAIERSRVAELKLKQRQDDGERDHLRLVEERDAAVRLLDGEDAAPRKTRRVNRLARLNAEAPALAAAIVQQEARVADAEGAVEAPRQPFVAATLAIVEDLQQAAVAEAREKLSELLPVAARLIAADQLRLALIGERFPMPRDRIPPFRGLSLVRAFVEAIPERLLPPALAETRLLDAAREISSDIIKQVKGDAQ